MRTGRAARVALASVAVAMGLAGEARAEPTSSDKALAETLFRDARTLMNAGKTPDACAKFAESQRLDPQLGTELNLALCHEKDGKTASAWAEFDEVAEQATRPADRQRADFARQHARDLEKKLSRVRLAIAGPTPDETVKLDGRSLSNSVWSTPFPVDPGDHQVEAFATGKKPWSQAVKVAVGPSTLDVNVPPLEDTGGSAAPAVAPAAPVASPAAAQQPSSPSAAPPPAEAADKPSQGSGMRTAGFVLAGVGLVGIGVGSIFGLQALSKNSTANDNCPNDRCNQTGVDAGKDASTFGLISDIGFGVGIVGLAVGTYFVLVPRSSNAKAARLGVSPLVGTRGGGAQLSGLW